jgi:hypothetical protein
MAAAYPQAVPVRLMWPWATKVAPEGSGLGGLGLGGAGLEAEIR